MRRVLGLMVVALLVTPALAEYSEPNIDGFFDAGMIIGMYEETSYDMFFNFLEVQASGEFTDWASYSAAFDVVSEDTAEFTVGIDLAPCYVDLHMPAQKGFFNTAGVKIGYNDIPFGWFYQEAATPDRLGVSAPITFSGDLDPYGIVTAGTFNGYLATEYGSLDAYMIYFKQATSAGGFTVPARWGYGARLDVTPIPWLHVGGSLVMINNGNADDTQTRHMRYGAHLRLEQWGVDFTGEFIGGTFSQYEADGEVGEDTETNIQGYYAQLGYHFDEIFAPMYLFVRYGALNPNTDLEIDGVDDTEMDFGEIAAGVGYNPIKWLGFKLEYKMNSEPDNDIPQYAEVDNDTVTLDCVVSF